MTYSSKLKYFQDLVPRGAAYECDDEDEPTIAFNMPALIEQQPIPEIEEHPYVGDSVGGVEYVSGFLSIKII